MLDPDMLNVIVVTRRSDGFKIDPNSINYNPRDWQDAPGHLDAKLKHLHPRPQAI
jgi:hypothetical protein